MKLIRILGHGAELPLHEGSYKYGAGTRAELEERITGGAAEPEHRANRSQPVGPEASQTPSAADSGC